MTGPTEQDLTPEEMRRLALLAQGLLKPAFGRGRQAVRDAVKHLGYIQIDTIAVVERAHHHALATRIPGYTASMLDALQQSRDVFEYWTHAAAYLPMEDYRFYLPMMQGYARKQGVDQKIAREIKARIRAEGPLQSRDFQSPAGHKSGGWWDWKPAKVALDQLFLAGELMVVRRENFQKVYDLTERALPSHIATAHPTEAEWGQYLAGRFTRALGIARKTDLAYARSTIRRFGAGDVMPHLEAALSGLTEAGILVPVIYQGANWYLSADLLARLPLRVSKQRVVFLSPFDNLVINRSRLQALFDFDYLIECYVPAHKRQYGYFCLPMLWGDEMVGRADIKANRKEQILEVQGLFLESDQAVSDKLVLALARGLHDFAAANGCSRVALQQTRPAQLKRRLSASLAN
ncbi:MAG: winged helix-turn-helix domain-containing protein [Pseudomonadota bacterium]